MAALTVVVWLVFGVGVPALVCWFAIRRTLREPRRLSNAYWLLVALLLLTDALAGLGVPGAGTAIAGLVAVLLAAPLLVACLAVFLILNGMIMVRREGRSLANLLSLLAGLSLLALIVVAVPVLISQAVWLVIGYAVVLLAVAYLGFQFAAFLGYSLLYPVIVRHRMADWVVVLGSGLGENSRVTPLLASRIRAGLAEFSRRGARLLIMSGGRGDDEQLAEAEAMAAWAVEHGAPAGAVLTETASRTTEQNLRFTAALIGERWPALASGAEPAVPDAVEPAEPEGRSTLPPGLIVTSNYHLLRAALLARRLKIPAQAAGAPTAGHYWPSAIIREFVAVLAERPGLHALLVAVVALPLPALAALAVALR